MREKATQLYIDEKSTLIKDEKTKNGSNRETLIQLQTIFIFKLHMSALSVFKFVLDGSKMIWRI